MQDIFITVWSVAEKYDRAIASEATGARMFLARNDFGARKHEGLSQESETTQNTCNRPLPIVWKNPQRSKMFGVRSNQFTPSAERY